MFGIVGVVFGALGFVLSFIPIINNIAAIFGFIGVILAIVALVGTFRGKKARQGIGDCRCGAVGVGHRHYSGHAVRSKQGHERGHRRVKLTIIRKRLRKNQPKGDQDMEGDLKTMHVKIVSAVRSNNDYNNQPTVLVTFEWTNNTDKNNSFAVLASPQVFQNGQALDTAIYSENPAGYDSNSDFAEVQPGATGTVTIGYTLKDDSEVTVDVTDLFDLNDSAKVVHKFTV